MYTIILILFIVKPDGSNILLLVLIQLQNVYNLTTTPSRTLLRVKSALVLLCVALYSIRGNTVMPVFS